MGIKNSFVHKPICTTNYGSKFYKIKGVNKMKENIKQRLFAAAILVALVGGSWLIVKYGKYKVDETACVRYHH